MVRQVQAVVREVQAVVRQVQALLRQVQALHLGSQNFKGGWAVVRQ